MQFGNLTLRMQPIQLKPLLHRGQQQIGIFFANNRELNTTVRKLKGVKWSQTHKCWYLPLNPSSYKVINEALASKTSLDATALKAYLNKRKAVASTVASAKAENTSQALVTSAAWKLNKENLAALQKFVEQLKLKAYSPSTIKTYRNEFLQLLQLLNKKTVHELTPDDLRRYFLYCFEKLKLTENTLHSRINAIKFYFEQVRGGEKFLGDTEASEKNSASKNVQPG